MNLNNVMLNGLLGKLRGQNPQAYNTLTNMMNSGQNPDQILNQLLASGQINQSQVNQAMQMANNFMNNNQNPNQPNTPNIPNTNIRRF